MVKIIIVNLEEFIVNYIDFNEIKYKVDLDLPKVLDQTLRFRVCMCESEE